jgi:hypothetical protein
MCDQCFYPICGAYKLIVFHMIPLFLCSSFVPPPTGSNQQPTLVGEFTLDGHALSLTVDVCARDAVVATDSGTIWYVKSS